MALKKSIWLTWDSLIGWCPAVMLQRWLFIGGSFGGKQEVPSDAIKLAHIKG